MRVPQPTFSTSERVAMGAQCRDCDPVPKIADAGQVFETLNGERIQMMHNGLRVVADGYYGEWMTDLIRICRGHHEAQEERLFHELMKFMPSEARMIELGGFWAYYSLWFLKDHPQRSALVIEPEPAHLEIGRRNAALNGLDPIFRQGFAGATYADAASFQCEVSGEQSIPRFSVAHLMEQQHWDHVNLLHCDIQGAETEVLESTRDLFRSGAIDWLFVSTHAHQISCDPLTHQRCLAILRECGAVIEAEHDVHESFSGDGLIVARFCAAPADWRPVSISSNRASKTLFRHLAWDLDEARSQVSRLETELAAARSIPQVHQSFQRSAIVFELHEDGPLGKVGDSIMLPDDQVMSPNVTAHAVWDPVNLDGFLAHLHPGKPYTLVDIGANVGLFSRQLALAAPQIERILCVEPEPANFHALNFNLVPLAGRASAFNAALAATDGEFEFFRDTENIGNYSLNPDAMRGRPHDSIRVTAYSTREWMIAHLGDIPAILWKSDTQGSDEVIVSLTPMEIWQRIDVAIMEMWRIAKDDYDREAFCARIESFPNRQLGEDVGISTADVMQYLAGNDWRFKDLLLWR